MDQLKDILNRLPVFLFLGVYLVTIACDMKDFLDENPESALFQKRQEVRGLQNEVDTLKQKEKQAEVFFKEYQARREALLARAQELRNMKNTLTDSIRQEDVLSIISKVSRKSGIRQLTLTPGAEVTNQFYFEKPFTLNFEGFYEQLMVFLTMLAREEKIFKVDDYTITPADKQVGQFIKIKGTLKINVYWYNSSKADKIGTELES